MAVLAEALSNAARHAQATRVEVALQATTKEVVLAVSDDGVGLPAEGRRSGLANLAERAQRLGGSFEASAAEEGGTRLVWRAPLERS
jgi:signal transduction histidine kinase